MFIFLTSTTTAECWFKETAFQLRESREGIDLEEPQQAAVLYMALIVC